MHPCTPPPNTRRQSRRNQRNRHSKSETLPSQDNEELRSDPAGSSLMAAKQPAALQDITNVMSTRKRVATSAPSEGDSVQSAAKKDKRSRETAAVTPVVSAAKERSAVRLDYSAPVAQQLLEQETFLPPGVVDIYAREKCKVCSCDQNHCSSQSLAHCFIRHYGQEYAESLKEWEADNSFILISADSSVSSSPAQAEEIECQPSTPPRRVNYVIGSIDEEQRSLDPSDASQPLPNQPNLSNKMREVLVDWMIELSQEYDLNTRTLHLAVSLLNRVIVELGKCDGVTRWHLRKDEFQCLGCSCLWIASKMEEREPPTAEDFIYISADSFTKDQFIVVEQRICAALQFRLFQVTPHHHVEELLRASNADRRGVECPVMESDVERSMVEYLLELSCLPQALSKVAPMQVACAAMYLSRVVLGLDGWSPTLEYTFGFSRWDLEDVVSVIYEFYAESEESKLLSRAYEKYTSCEHHSVALKTVPWKHDLGFYSE